MTRRLDLSKIWPTRHATERLESRQIPADVLAYVLRDPAVCSQDPSGPDRWRYCRGNVTAIVSDPDSTSPTLITVLLRTDDPTRCFNADDRRSVGLPES